MPTSVSERTCERASWVPNLMENCWDCCWCGVCGGDWWFVVVAVVVEGGGDGGLDAIDERERR